MLHILYKNTKSCRGTHSRKRRGRNCCYKGKTCIWIVQGFWKKSAELEVIFNSCWVLEIQNEVSANQRGSSTNHIGRFGGLDVISGIIRGQVLEPSIYNWEMARTARKHSDSGVYHVILRGVKRIIGDRFTVINPSNFLGSHQNKTTPDLSIVKRLGGSSTAKVRHLFGLCKDFEEKVWKWTWSLTDNM